MAGLGDALKIGSFVVDRIGQVAGWLKRKARREDVQKMDDAIDNNNGAVVNDKLNKLRNSVKDKQDGRS